MNFSEDIEDGFTGANKELPFRVPRHYFNDFPARLQFRIEQESKPSVTRRLNLIDYIKPVLGLAAAFAAVFVLVYYPARLVTRPALTVQNTEISDDDKIINLVEHEDDQTFYSLLENSSTEEKLDGTDIESYIAANYSDYDIYQEIQK
jgi:hypothetical protein